MPTRLCAAHQLHRRDGRGCDHVASRSVPVRAGTTTTATPGSETSATADRQSRRRRHSLFDNAVVFVRDRLLARAGLSPPTPSPAETCPTNGDSILPGYPGGTAVSETRSTDNSSSTSSANRCSSSPPPPRFDRLDADGWRAAELAADDDRRPLERGGRRHLGARAAHGRTSRLICAAGLRRSAIAAAGSNRPRGSRSPTIVADTAPRGTPPIRTMAAASDDPARTPHSSSPLSAVPSPPTIPDRSQPSHAVIEMTEDGYAYRFRPDERPLGDAEGAFLVCGFWLSLAGTAGRNTRAQPAGSNEIGPHAGLPACSRGVRRRPTAAARKPPASVRPRATPRMRNRAGGLNAG